MRKDEQARGVTSARGIYRENPEWTARSSPIMVDKYKLEF